MTRTMILALVVALSACSAPTNRLALTPQPSALELRPLVGSAMVRTISLPTYAAAEEIARETPDGLIGANDDVLWADDPQRAATLVLTGTLSDILSIDVSPEPWPFVGLPDVAIDVRVARILARADGQFVLAGQFFVGGDGIDFLNTATDFDITVPMTDQSLASIANAQSTALVQLAEAIARQIGR